MNTIFEIAKEIKRLSIIDTTSDLSGYPRGLSHALIGFKSFEEANELAEKNNLSIRFFTKKDGWNLWYSTGNTAYEAITVDPSDIGDDYMQESITSLEEVENRLEGIDQIQVDSFRKDLLEIYEACKKAPEGYIVISCEGKYYDTVQGKTMHMHEDGRHTVIGLV